MYESNSLPTELRDRHNVMVFYTTHYTTHIDSLRQDIQELVTCLERISNEIDTNFLMTKTITADKKSHAHALRGHPREVLSQPPGSVSRDPGCDPGTTSDATWPTESGAEPRRPLGAAG